MKQIKLNKRAKQSKHVLTKYASSNRTFDRRVTQKGKGQKRWGERKWFKKKLFNFVALRRCSCLPNTSTMSSGLALWKDYNLLIINGKNRESNDDKCHKNKNMLSQSFFWVIAHDTYNVWLLCFDIISIIALIHRLVFRIANSNMIVTHEWMWMWGCRHIFLSLLFTYGLCFAPVFGDTPIINTCRSY